MSSTGKHCLRTCCVHNIDHLVFTQLQFEFGLVVTIHHSDITFLEQRTLDAGRIHHKVVINFTFFAGNELGAASGLLRFVGELPSDWPAIVSGTAMGSPCSATNLE